MRFSKFPQQLIPLIILASVCLVALIVARSLLVPKTFGEYGHYRASAVDEIAAQEISYAGYTACAECHSDIYELKQKSHHKNVSCEVCHGAAVEHVKAPDEFTPAAPRDRGSCPLCHGYDPSRPSGFPQILPNVHNPGKACMSCHNPHNPLLPHAPEECSACHREIYNLKTVSPHAALPCTRCHNVPAEHLANPRFAVAERPVANEFCGGCHSLEADSPKEIPRVDLVSHAGRYMCWDCHYPHDPRERT